MTDYYDAEADGEQSVGDALLFLVWICAFPILLLVIACCYNAVETFYRWSARKKKETVVQKKE